MPRRLKNGSTSRYRARRHTRRISMSLVLTALIAPAALAVGSGTAHAVADCDVPIPPPVCEGLPPTHPTPTPVKRVRGDFDGDGKADLTVFRSYNASWYTIGSKTGQALPTTWFGQVQFTNVAAPGHFDADNRMDHGVLQKVVGPTPAYDSANIYYRSSVLNTGEMSGGHPASYYSEPVIADFTGDGKDEMASRTYGGIWHVPGFPDRAWGVEGDWPVQADYDKDGKADLAVFRPSNGTWYVVNSSTGAVTTRQWGQQGDRPVPGDYDNDGKTDIAVFRPSNGTWYVVNSSTGGWWSFAWGQQDDKPVPLDYNGDGRTDLAVWRPANGTWYVWPTGASSGYYRQWGVYGDTPIS